MHSSVFTSKVPGLLTSLIGAGALLLYAGLCILVFNLPASFDGAFHLQAVETLIENGDMALTYDGYRKFDYAIQMGLPYLGSIAVAFTLFGHSVFVAKAVTLLYFALLLLVAYRLSRKIAGSVFAAIGVLLACSISNIHLFALNMFGEIVALFWFLLGCLALSEPPTDRRAVLAGVCFGLAVLTKIVLFLIVPAVLVTALIAVWGRQYQLLRTLAIALACMLLVVLGFELYRAINLGWEGYLHYWNAQTGLILSKGGSGGASLSQFAESYASAQRRGLWPAAWIAGAVLLFIASLSWLLQPWKSAAGIRSMLKINNLGLCLALVLALGYFAWWFLVAPSAYYRRLINPLVLLSFLLPTMLVWCWQQRHFLNRGIALLMGLALAFMLVNGFASKPWVWSLQPPSRAGAEFVRALPDRPQLAGWGWWQSPRLSFQLQQPFLDLRNPQSRAKMRPGRDLIVIHSQQKTIAPRSIDHLARYMGELAGKTEDGYEFYYYSDAYRQQQLVELAAIPMEALSPAITFPISEEDRRQLLWGFYRPGNNSVWAETNAALVLPRLPQFRFAQLGFWLNEKALPEGHESMNIGISINAEPVMIIPVKGGVTRVAVPLPEAGQGSLWLIELNTPYAFRPVDYGLSGDDRSLSLLLLSAELSREAAVEQP